MKEELREQFRDALLTIPSARLVSGGKEVLMRCRYCEDSRDPKSAHMYVSIPQSDDSVSLFNCYKCPASGVVTHSKLIEWGLYLDTNLLIEVSKYNKKTLALDKNKMLRDSAVYRLDNSFISDNKLSQVKLKYINNRLGINLSYNDLLEKKIILNLYDLLKTNNIQKLSRNSNIVDQLNESFIGFITQDNAFVNMRNLTPGKVHKSIDKRYINYNIFNKMDNTQRYYTIPTSIDLTNPKRIRLNISEGPFDILSVFYNLRNQESYHNIYSSILGSSYLAICRHFINVMKLINLEVHVYIDNDIKDYIIQELKELLYPFNIPLYIHKNIYPGEKDFGVRIEKINEQIFPILTERG